MMEKIPKHSIHKEPEGYFDSLADRIIRKKRKKSRQIYIYRAAAAVALVVGSLIFLLETPKFNEISVYAYMDEEIELYINSGYWDAEDVLGFASNPDEILDQIIEEEWAVGEISEEFLDEEIWY